MQQQLMLKGAMNLKGNKEEYKGGFSEQRERRLYYNLKKKKVITTSKPPPPCLHSRQTDVGA